MTWRIDVFMSGVWKLTGCGGYSWFGIVGLRLWALGMHGVAFFVFYA